MNPLERARAHYNSLCEERDAAIQAVEATADDTPAEDVEALTAAAEEAQRAIETYQPELKRLESIYEARDNTPALQLGNASSAEVTSSSGNQSTASVRHASARGASRDEEVYRPDLHDRSFLQDIYKAGKGDQEAYERLERNNRLAAAEARDVTSADPGAAGFIPPNYMAAMWQDLPRAERVFANRISTFPFPNQGLTLTIPKVQTGVSVASQAGEGQNLSETDIDTQSLTVYQETIGGLQDISQQALEFSFPGMDMVILDDLRRAYDAELERQLFHGAGHGSNELDGILGVTGNNDITWTETTPTGTTGLKSIYSAVSEIATDTSGYAQASDVYMHPRRAAWFASQTSTSAPIFQQGSLVQTYAQGTQGNGFAGTIGGLPVYQSAAILTTRGSSTNQDVIFVIDPRSLRLAESTPRVETFRDVLSQSLQVRIRLYAYVYFVSGRLPAALGNIEGTGLVTPSFA